LVYYSAVTHRDNKRKQVSQSQTRQNGSSVRALARGLNILRCFDKDHRELGLIEISRLTGLHKTTALRLVKTLESAEFLAVDDATGKYHLGRSIFRAVHLLLSPTELVRVAHPHMQRLSEETGESIVMTVWTEDGPLLAHIVLTWRQFKPPVETGLIFTDLANASSKVFLAFGPEKRLAAALAKPLVKFTEHTIIDPQKMDDELNRVRHDGVAYDMQEYRLETCAVAAPARDSTGEVRLVLCVVAPVERSAQHNMSRYAKAVKKAAAAVSRDLEYAGSPED
jgi:IclR family acetate operon transcriptional repressor